MNEPTPEPLSREGNARREAMVGPLVEVMRRTHRSRRRRRQMVAGAGTLSVLFMVLKLAMPGGMTTQDDAQFADQGGDVILFGGKQVPGPRAWNWEIIRAYETTIIGTDPTVRDRFRAAPARRVAMLTDRMLLDDLVALGRPAGLIRMGNQVRLSAPVTNADLGLTLDPAPDASG